MPDAPTLDEVKAFLRLTTSDDDAAIQEIIDAVTARQTALVRDLSDETTWPEELRQAFYRRVARTLNARSMPLGIVAAGDFGTQTLPRFDSEIREYEASWLSGAFA